MGVSFEGVDTVIECRRFLQWSHVLGFFCEDSSEKEVLDMHLSLLEEFTDHLHELTEILTTQLLLEPKPEEGQDQEETELNQLPKWEQMMYLPKHFSKSDEEILQLKDENRDHIRHYSEVVRKY
eukprot:TRINITY_DN11221_c0_g1_i2.p1 TRINITY_DN11221_c0_g1~~TRINITY_DN11221_c0_g1_i2.p1  ORF type:complete len:124 (+),score=25.04 TRINITY_DN11221_c0_g1_i2:114-485(+)